LTASYISGSGATAVLTAKQTVTFVGVAYLKVDVGQAPIETATVVPNADGSAAVNVTFSKSAAAGHYQGDIIINVCKDANCTSHLSGSPFKLPYAIDIIPAEGGFAYYNLKPLVALAGAPDWGTQQGNAQHTGYVPVTLDPASFSARWKWLVPASNGLLTPTTSVASGGNRLYLGTGGDWIMSNPSHKIRALNEHDASEAWAFSFDDLRFPSVNPPAYAAGMVYMSAGQQDSTWMFGFDAATGSLKFKSRMSSQWETYLAPTVFNGVVYSDGGSYGGLYAFDSISGELKFFAGLPQYDGWTPAFDETNAYVYLDGSLHVLDPASGAERNRIADPLYSWNGYSPRIAPVVGSDGLVFGGNRNAQVDNSLIGFDVAAGNARWSVKGDFPGACAYADKLLFCANNASHALEVRSATDGAVAWQWAQPAGETFIGDALVTRNLIFISTAGKTYAIDRATHGVVWSYAAGGQLAMTGNGTLIITKAGSVVAINLH